MDAGVGQCNRLEDVLPADANIQLDLLSLYPLWNGQAMGVSILRIGPGGRVAIVEGRVQYSSGYQ
jgi:hypothetical protein